MDTGGAFQALEKSGYGVISVTRILEGLGHDNFQVELRDGRQAVAKFENDAHLAPDGKRKDFHYNGELSLEREAATAELLRWHEFPAPQTYGLHKVEGKRFLLVEKLPGRHWREFLEENGHSREAYLCSLKFLGADIAKAQRLTMRSYGDIINYRVGLANPVLETIMVSQGTSKFSERFSKIVQFQLQRAEQTEALAQKEAREVQGYFITRIENIPDRADTRNPVFVFSDLHPMNFLVDAQGKPSGYFDLEHCQAGVTAQDVSHHALHLFNYFDEATSREARKAFFNGFIANGGRYLPEDEAFLEHPLGAARLLGFVSAYHGAQDGLRDTWAARFKDLLFEMIQTNQVPTVAVADIFREKTRQPRVPNTIPT